MGAHTRSESQIAKRVDARTECLSTRYPGAAAAPSARGVAVPESIRPEFTDLLPVLRLFTAEHLLPPRVVPVDHLLDGPRDGVAAPSVKGSSMDRFQANLLWFIQIR